MFEEWSEGYMSSNMCKLSNISYLSVTMESRRERKSFKQVNRSGLLPLLEKKLAKNFDHTFSIDNKYIFPPAKQGSTVDLTNCNWLTVYTE